MSLTQQELERMADTPIGLRIPPADVERALASEPFIHAPPMLNLRDLGLVPGSAIKPGIAYRCGMISDDDASKAWIAANVQYIFDLRSASEIRQSPDPTITGTQAMWMDMDGPPRRPSIEDFAKGDGSEGWSKTYLEIFEGRASAIRNILEHVRDRPKQPFLFHCTGKRFRKNGPGRSLLLTAAGRDRTGVVASILHSLAGTPPSSIVFDHRLTRIGIEPQREMLMEKVKIMFGLGDTTALEHHQGYNNFGNLSPKILPLLDDLVSQRYGSLEGYICNHLQMSQEDVETIKINLQA